MSSHRALANHALYLARIQISAWQDQLSREQIPVSTLAQAFLPSIGGHLRTAYGYFLLTLLGVTEVQSTLPGSVAQLPPAPAGEMLPPEIAEFVSLEQQGWLADMLAAAEPLVGEPAHRVSRAPGLATTPAAAADAECALQWCAALENLFDRMSDSLDEY